MPAAPTLAIDLNTVVLAVIGFVLSGLLGLLLWLARQMLEGIRNEVAQAAAGVSTVASTVSMHTTDIAVLRAEIAHLRAEASNAQLRYTDLIGFIQKLAKRTGADDYEPRRSQGKGDTP